jgi:hypothetical protein
VVTIQTLTLVVFTARGVWNGRHTVFIHQTPVTQPSLPTLLAPAHLLRPRWALALTLTSTLTLKHAGGPWDSNVALLVAMTLVTQHHQHTRVVADPSEPLAALTRPVTARAVRNRRRTVKVKVTGVVKATRHACAEGRTEGVA